MRHENSLWLGNHRYEVDWLLGWVVTQRLGLAGVRFYFQVLDKFDDQYRNLGFKNSW
jgi:hypothetical protein